MLIFPNSWKRLKIWILEYLQVFSSSLNSSEWDFFPCFNIVSDCEDCLSGRLYVLGKGACSHYVTILWLMTCLKHCCQTYMTIKIAKFSWGSTATTTPNSPVLFWNKPYFFANSSLCSDSSQYAIIISKSLLLIQSSHLELKHKWFLNDWFGPKWMC